MPLSDELQTDFTGSVSPEDPRWQVIERIVSSPCFQRSERLKAFLKYVAQQYLAGRADRLTGHQIGTAVFGKAGQDQTEDNTVRIYARQLRLRLLEYFDTYGRDEPLVVEIPKGSYIPVFRPAAPAALEQSVAALTERTPEPMAEPAIFVGPGLRAQNWIGLTGWALALALAVALGSTLFRTAASPPQAVIPPSFELWPLSELGARSEQTQIVLCDNSFALYQVAGRRHFTLSDYLKPEYPANVVPQPEVRDQGVDELFDQLRHKQLTSYADSATAARISHLNLPGSWVTRPARDIKLREVQEGNYLLLGSSWSNPWVELYEPHLNFVLTNAPPLAIVNRHPGRDESASYLSQGTTGNMGDDYAAIALIPNEKRGVVMIVQGTKEEGTEAAGLFVTDPEGRKALRQRLHLKPSDVGHTYFEALLRTKTYAGASTQTQVLAVRRVSGGH